MDDKDKRYWGQWLVDNHKPLQDSYDLAAAWEEINPTGEGYFPAWITDDFGNYIGLDDTAPLQFFQWVRITNGNKVLATFFLKEQAGELVEMFLAVARKGKAPNPFDPLTDPDLMRWRAQPGYVHVSPPQSMGEVEARVKDFTAYRASTEYVLDGDEENTPEKILEDIEDFRIREIRAFNARRDSRVPAAISRDNTTFYGRGKAVADRGDNVRPTTAVVAVPAKDNDTRFKFRAGNKGFTMKGSKLAPRLLAARRAELRSVDIKFL